MENEIEQAVVDASSKFDDLLSAEVAKLDKVRTRLARVVTAKAGDFVVDDVVVTPQPTPDPDVPSVAWSRVDVVTKARRSEREWSDRFTPAQLRKIASGDTTQVRTLVGAALRGLEREFAKDIAQLAEVQWRGTWQSVGHAVDEVRKSEGPTELTVLADERVAGQLKGSAVPRIKAALGAFEVFSVPMTGASAIMVPTPVPLVLHVMLAPNFIWRSGALDANIVVRESSLLTTARPFPIAVFTGELDETTIDSVATPVDEKGTPRWPE